MKRRTFTALCGAVLLTGCIGRGDDALFDNEVKAGESTYSSFEARVTNCASRSRLVRTARTPVSARPS